MSYKVYIESEQLPPLAQDDFHSCINLNIKVKNIETLDEYKG